jgi:hypothetical protein
MSIRIDDLGPDQIGAWVNYIRATSEPRKGRIKYWNQRFVFVVFDCANQWDRFTDFVAAPTNPEDLDLVVMSTTE